MPSPNEINNTPKRCFVIMGFGIKTDFATGRKLDLNKSYRLLIKPVVETKGLTCVRADEILHSGSIDYQMYRELLNADIVIADLSTANVNAFYELGIRHALRKRNTIVISEDKLGYPFDLNHIKITSYTHLGEAIDYEEVDRFRKILGDTIDTVLNAEDIDSPIYTHLQELTPPLISSNKPSLLKIFNVFYRGKTDKSGEQTEVTIASDNPTLAVLIEQGEESMHIREYANAKALFETALKLMKEEASHNSYLLQRLAFATYKAKVPDVITALNEAMDLLTKLDIDHTNDTETVSLAGRIQKKLHEKGHGDHHLACAIQYFERGYFLLHNRYHGINLAFLLVKHADSTLSKNNEDRIADLVWANRIRRQVLNMCEKDWKEINERKSRMTLKMGPDDSATPSGYDVEEDNEQLFWIMANKAECFLGLGDIEEYKKADEQARNLEHTEWMMKSYNEQLAELKELMKKHGHLVNPKWQSE